MAFSLRVEYPYHYGSRLKILDSRISGLAFLFNQLPSISSLGLLNKSMVNLTL